MEYFRDSSGAVYAYRDTATQQRLRPDLTPMTPEEIEAHLHPPLTPEQLQASLQASLQTAVQLHLDQAAQTHGYDNVFTACTYADEPVIEKFQVEGQAFRAWRSQVWAVCYQILDDVLAGTRPAPTESDLITELPALDLP